MNDISLTRVTSSPLTTPTSTHAATAAIDAGTGDQPLLMISPAVSVCERPSWKPIETSK